MASLGLGGRRVGPARVRLDRDAWMVRAFILVIAVYLVVALALPLYTMLSKSFSTYRFDLATFELQIDRGEGWSAPTTLAALAEGLPSTAAPALDTNHDGRLSVASLVADFSFRSPTRYRLRNAADGAVFLIGSERIADRAWHEFSSNELRRVVVRPSVSRGVDNYLTYFTTPLPGAVDREFGSDRADQHDRHGVAGVRIRLRVGADLHELARQQKVAPGQAVAIQDPTDRGYRVEHLAIAFAGQHRDEFDQAFIVLGRHLFNAFGSLHDFGTATWPVRASL